MFSRRSTRRALIPSVLLVLLTTACGQDSGERADGSASSGPSPDPSASSLLLVTLDTTRADHLGPWGASFAETGTLDSLAAEGALFEQAFAVAPTTAPSHATMLTGLDPSEHGLRQNGLHVLRDDVPTLATLLDTRGFATAAFVSAAVLAREAGLGRGFAVYDDRLPAVERRGDLVDERRAGETIDAARSWLDELAPDEPFFLWVHLFDPHAPFAPPPPWDERFAERPYDGEIAYLDAELGRLLDHPRVDATTVVSVVGDHGESLGEHGEDAHGLLLYDATLHVPWLIRGPGIVRGRRLVEPAAHVDLVPTLFDLLGIEGPGGPGHSWAGVLVGSSEPGPERRIYAETFHPYYSYGWAPLRSLREDSMKLIEAPTPELYDLEEDPGELRNVYAERRGDGRRLRRELVARLEDDAGPDEARTIDGSTARGLEALGYVARSAAGRERERLDPKEVVELHRLVESGRAALDSREPARALELFERVLERDPHNLISLEKGGLAAAQLGRFEEAHRRLAAAIESYPEVPELPLVRARIHLMEGRPAAALEAAETVLAETPDSVEALTGAAIAAGALGRTDEAARRAARAHELDPDDVGARIVWSQLVGLPEGRAERVVELLEPLTIPEARREDVWRFLGLAREALGDPAAAEAVYRAGLDQRPDSGLLYARLGVLLASRGDPRAGAHLQEADRLLEPTPPMVALGLARLAAGAGEWEEVAAQARRAVAADGSLADAWVLLAAAEEELGDPEAALVAYERALSAVPDHPGALFNRALLRRRLQRFDGAIADLERVLAGDPGHAAAHYELGVIFGALGEGARARQHLERARTVGHPRPDLIDRLLSRLPS